MEWTELKVAKVTCAGVARWSVAVGVAPEVADWPIGRSKLWLNWKFRGSVSKSTFLNELEKVSKHSYLRSLSIFDGTTKREFHLFFAKLALNTFK